MKRNLSLVVALASAVAFSPTVEAKADKDKGGKHGGGARNAPSAQSRPQMRSGGNVARVQPNRFSNQVQRYNRPQLQRNVPSVALTGRSLSQQRAAQQQQLAQRQRVAERGENWNERRKKLINQYYRRERLEDRRERWEDRHDDWDHHDWDDDHDHYYVPYNVYRYWDHNRIYYWNNYPYHWYNNAWVVLNPGLGYGYGDYYGPDYGYRGDYYGGGSVTARVQNELARQGYDPGPIDGAIGPRTRDAIIDYQRDHELPVTGRVDTPLLRALGL